MTKLSRTRSQAIIKLRLKHLGSLRNKFGGEAESRKLALLGTLRRQPILRANDLIAYHELLSFCRAYPESAAILQAAETELKSFGARIERYRAQTRDNKGEKLVGSGIVNTTTNYPYGYDIVRMLTQWYPRAVEIDWEGTDKEWLVTLFNALSLMVTWEENDVLDNDTELDPRKWLELAKGSHVRNDLRGLLTLFSTSALPEDVQRYFYEDLGLYINWDLHQSPASRTLHRLPARKIFYQREALRGRSKDLLEELQKPPTPLKLVSEAEGARLVRAINEMLAVRDRELYPTTFASSREVYVNEPGRGMQIYLFGTMPEYRLPLEVNYGALLIRNGMPIGYGVAVCLFEQVEIAINVFPAFRGGESAWIIEQFFRLFYHHFGSRILVVRRKQMGYQEDEALYSGAFWFYYKLGFRAINPRVRKLAEAENKKIQSRASYKVPIQTMKRLAKSDVALLTSGTAVEDFTELSIVNLGYQVTKYFAETCDGDRREGTQQAVKDAMALLGLGSTSTWSPSERQALERLAPLVLIAPGVKSWSAQEKRALAEVVWAKGSVHERDFVLQSIKHTGLKKSLEMLAHRRPA